jgi:hypothetical protein
MNNAIPFRRLVVLDIYIAYLGLYYKHKEISFSCGKPRFDGRTCGMKSIPDLRDMIAMSLLIDWAKLLSNVEMQLKGASEGHVTLQYSRRGLHFLELTVNVAENARRGRRSAKTVIL